jgi:nucleolar complex protein 2
LKTSIPLRTFKSQRLVGYTAKMPQSKATKKFEKNRLHDVLKKRKDVSKIKQRKQMTAKRKERNARDNAPADGVEGVTKKPKTNGTNDDAFGEMSMDQFFQGGFQIPEMKKKPKSKTGKRKRTPVEENGTEDSDVDMEEATAAAEESASESESGDDTQTHKEQLAALADKDPEFFKYLKENDAELLDFAEDADLAEIDALSASEDEAVPRKKQKSKASKDDVDEEETASEVSKKLINKWKLSMEENHSLRAMREVVLAFRAAAHLSDDAGKTYKYNLTDPDGTHILKIICASLTNPISIPRGRDHRATARP